MKPFPELVHDALTAVALAAENIPALEIVSESAIPKGLWTAPATAAQAASNSWAIRSCMAQKNRVDFQPGLVQVDQDIRVASGAMIQGLGTPDRQTVLQVVPRSVVVQSRGPASSWYSIFQSNTPSPYSGETFGLPTGPAHGVTIRNLVLDGGFNEQVKDAQGRMPTTTQAITIEGLGLVVEDVVIRNCAKGLWGGECFPIRMFAPLAKANEPRAARLSRVRCQHIGSAGSTHPGLGGDEITLFSLVGSPENMLACPVIEDCFVEGLRRGGGVQPSPIQVFHQAYHIGGRIADNAVLDSDATCVYQDTGKSQYARITRNTFANVHRGVCFDAVTDFEARDFLISDNIIRLFDSPPFWNANGSPAGILLQKVEGAGTGFKRGMIARNQISAPVGPFGEKNFYGRGIYLELRSKLDATGILALDNLIDVVQPPASSFYPANWGDMLSIYIANQNAWDDAAPCLRASGNRNSAGVKSMITITDAAYTAKRSVLQMV